MTTSKNQKSPVGETHAEMGHKSTYHTNQRTSRSENRFSTKLKTQQQYSEFFWD